MINFTSAVLLGVIAATTLTTGCKVGQRVGSHLADDTTLKNTEEEDKRLAGFDDSTQAFVASAPTYERDEFIQELEKAKASGTPVSETVDGLKLGLDHFRPVGASYLNAEQQIVFEAFNFKNFDKVNHLSSLPDLGASIDPTNQLSNQDLRPKITPQLQRDWSTKVDEQLFNMTSESDLRGIDFYNRITKLPESRGYKPAAGGLIQRIVDSRTNQFRQK